ncbi:MAG: Flp pilus assembly protein CpaB [Pseudomonadota bacterium]
MNRPPSSIEVARQRNRRVMVYSLSLSICFGTLAVVLTDQILDEQVARTRTNAPKPVPMTTVVIARNEIPFGARLSGSMLEEKRWPADAVPQGAFQRISALLRGSSARIARARFVPGEPILPAKLSGRGTKPTLAAILSPGMKAISIKVDEVVGVSGFVLPGDLVDILVTRTDRDVGADEPKYEPFTVTVLYSVRILAVDQTRDGRSEAAKPARTVTVEASLRDSQKLALAGTVGKLTLVLRDPLAPNTAQSVGRVTVSQLFGEEQSGSVEVTQTSLAAGPSNQRASTPSRKPTSTIRVVRQIDATDYEVRRRVTSLLATNVPQD